MSIQSPDLGRGQQAGASALDHLVINVLKDMDAAEAAFAALGFTLTPRGHHSLGSINHLMVSRDSYLELVGVPETGLQRQEVLDSPLGISGLVFASDTAEETFARLSGADLPALEPLAFSRPLVVDGVERDVAFRTVRMAPGFLPAGRTYFCQHMTPDLVWRPEWLVHANCYCGIGRVIIESPDADRMAERYAAVAGSQVVPGAAGWRVPLPNADLVVRKGEKARFVTAELIFAALDEIERRAQGLPAAVWHRHGPDVATLALPAFHLEFLCIANSARSPS